MALSVIKVLVTRKRDEVVRGKWRLVLVEFNGEFTLVRGDYRGVCLVGIKAVARSIFKCRCANFAAINGWAWGFASNCATLNWCC